MKRIITILLLLLITAITGCAISKVTVFKGARVMTVGNTSIIFLDKDGNQINFYSSEAALERFRDNLRKAEASGSKTDIIIDRLEKLEKGYSGYIFEVTLLDK